MYMNNLPKVQTAFGECVTHKKFEQSFYKVCILTGNTAQRAVFLVKLHTL